MRIVVNNNTIEVTCQHCKSVLALTIQDIKDNDQAGPHCKCAACGERVPVPMSKIPKHWREDLDWE